MEGKMKHKAAFVLGIAILCGLQARSKDIDSTTHPNIMENQAVGDVFCPEEILQVGLMYGVYFFPKTIATKEGTEVKIDCQYGFRNDGFQPLNGEQETLEQRIAESGVTRKCLLKQSGANDKWIGEWQDVDIKHCKKDMCNDEQLEIWSQAVAKIDPMQFRFMEQYVKNMAECAENDYEFAEALISGLDKIVRKPEFSAEVLSVKHRDALLYFVGYYAQMQADKMPPGYKSQIGVGSIIVETVKFYSRDRYLTVNSHKRLGYEFQMQPYDTSVSTLQGNGIDVLVSAEALLSSMENVSNPHLTITIYSSDADIFKVTNDEVKTTTTTTIKAENNEPPEYLSNQTESCQSDLVDCELSLETWGRGLLSIELDGTINNLNDRIEFTVRNYTVINNQTRIRCVYWDTKNKTWSTEGVETIDIPDGFKCRSTHLSAFSALIEPLPLPFPDAEYAPINNSIHKHILSILSSIGSVCSIVGLFFTLLTYGLFRSLRKERSNRILINLSASLLLMHIMSVSGSKGLWDGYCFVPAASLHYLVLTSLAWMMTEAIHMYDLLVSVFVRPENRFLIKRVLLAWGIPLVIVSACAIFYPEVYRVGRADLCLMSAHQNIVLYYAAYIGPICIMLLVNIVIFSRVFRVLYQQTKRSNKRASHGTKSGPTYQFVKISPTQIKGATTVLVLLGIGWVLGLLAIGPFEVFFRYMYCVCNAGQGLLIFIFRVLLNPQASKQWKKVIIGLSSDSSSSLDSSVTTSTTGNGKGEKRKSTLISPTFISASNSVENSLTASNPLSATLASTLASILRSEDMRAAEQNNIPK